jgi:formate-dependent nitrite reductase membrane component NrfD
MSTEWPAYRVLGLASGLLTAIGLVGLWVCKQVREHRGITERQFMETTSGGVAVWSLSACFVLGLLLLFPISLYLQKRAGVSLPGPTLPGWIAWPLTVVMILGFCLLLLIVVGLALTSFFHR